VTGDPVGPTPADEADVVGGIDPDEVVGVGPTEPDVVVEVEVLDRQLVVGSARPPLARSVPQGAALVQTAAVAATGFVAGVATAAVLGRRRHRRLAGPATGDPQTGAVRVASHRTYLVDVRLLDRG
jgi:hypothetical protein